MTKDNNLQSRASMRRFINWAEVKSRVSLSRSTVWRRIHEGSFPAPVRNLSWPRCLARPRD